MCERAGYAPEEGVVVVSEGARLLVDLREPGREGLRETALYSTSAMALPSRPSAPQHLGTALVLGLACTPSGSDTTTGLSVPDTWAGSSTGGSSDAVTTDLSATASATSTASSATTSASTDDSSPTTDATTLIYDVGPDTTDSDTADTKPPGCKGKIDFLRDLAPRQHEERAGAAHRGFSEVHRDDRGEVPPTSTSTSWSSMATTPGA
ncbi:MAG: hypothetical protein IPK80_19535 [Nannocystis sp.]|nr:hypothetical protein [Nannocystis sp.]